MKTLLLKILRRLKKEVKKVSKKIKPATISIPNLNYESNLNKKPKIAIVGLGPQGHKLALYLHNMKYNIVALCDLNSKRVSSLNKKITNAIPVNDIKDLKNIDIDICVVATLANSHLPLIKVISNLGINKILCEKPITNSIDDNIELKKFVKEKNIHLEVYHPALFSQDFIRFKEAIESQNKGKFLKGNIFFKAGGIGNIGSHVFSSFLFLTDIKFNSIKSATLSDTDGTSRGKDFYDPNGKVILNTNNNKEIIVENSKDFNFKAQKILLEFENCYVNFYDGKKLTIISKNDLNSDLELVAKKPVNGHLGRYTCIDNAIKSLVNNETSISLDYAIEAIELVIGGHLSYNKNIEIKLPIDSGTPKIYNFS